MKILGHDVTFYSSEKSKGMVLVAQSEVNKTKTNIGTAYVDIYNAILDPKNFSIDFLGYKMFRIITAWDYVGAGTQQFRFVDASLNVLYESSTFTVDQDPNDSGWQNIPSAFIDLEKVVRPQGKSTTSTDDPIFKYFRIYLKR